jgi:WD40 repeat protein/tRNA A-37 threonylcarbamoyl transferase component Bud32
MPTGRSRALWPLLATALRRDAAGQAALFEQARADDPELAAEAERILGSLTETGEEGSRTVAELAGSTAAWRMLIGMEMPSSKLHVACPDCHEPVELEPTERDDDCHEPLELEPTERDDDLELVCPSCGSTFRLSPDDMAPHSRRERLHRLGRFEVVKMVGSGGFGTVYKAIDPELSRVVAVKVLRLGNLASDDDRDRFSREARNAAQLRHPAIVPVHEIGEHEGLPFIVSDFIDGVTLSDWLTAHKPSFRESAELAAEIADALHYAHEQGVVHRDVKPSNIMLDLRNRPHLMDFGLAKRDVGEITVTIDGQILGTPAYMSPEQARGEAHKVDRRSDVYSLGVVFFLLLTGELPFRGNPRMLIHQVLHDEPRPPRQLVDTIPRDLETICIRALAKEPARRYPGAKELSDDLKNYLSGRPILARPVGGPTRLALWARRNVRVAALSATIYFLSILLAAGAFAAILRIRAAQGDARNSLIRLNNQNALQWLQAGRPASALPWLVETLRIAGDDPALEEVQRRRIASVLRGIPKLAACWLHEEAIDVVEFSPDPSRVLIAGGSTARVFDFTTRRPVTPVLRLEPDGAGPSPSQALARFSPDGKLVLTGSGRHVSLWDAATGRPPLGPILHDSTVTSIGFSPDGRRFATASGTIVQVREVAGGRASRPPMEHPDVVNHLAFSPDGRRLLASYGGPRLQIGGARIWDLEAPGDRPVRELQHEDDVYHGEYSPDGRWIVTSSYDNSARIWDSASGECLSIRYQKTKVIRSRFSPDSRRILSVSGPEARVWSAPSLGLDGSSLVHPAAVLDAAFSRDGTRIATCVSDRTARVWDAHSGLPVLPPLPHNGMVTCARFSPDGRFLITGSTDRVARVWDLAIGTWPVRSLLHGCTISHAAYAPGGPLMASISREGICRIWDGDAGAAAPIVVRHGGRGDHVALAPGGDHVATVGQDGVARVWDARSGRQASGALRHLKTDAPANLHPDEKKYSCAFSRDGNLLLSFNSHEALVWDWRRDRLLAAIRPEGKPSLTHAAIRPDGTLVLVTLKSGKAMLYAIAADARPRIVLTHDAAVVFGEFSPDGRTVLTTSADRTGRLWESRTGDRLASFEHGAQVNHGAFSADGHLVATASSDHTVRVWDTRTGKLAIPLLHHEGPVLHVTFSPDGRLIASGAGGEEPEATGETRIWDLAIGGPVSLPMRHGTGVRSLAFGPDGKSILTVAYRDPSAKVWALSRSSLPAEELDRIARLLSGVAVAPNGGETPVAAAELVRIHEELAARRPDAISTPVEEVLAWREAEARSFLDSREWSAALACYDVLLRAAPGNLRFLESRGDCHAGLRDWARSASDMLEAIAAGSDDILLRNKAVLLLLKQGDLARYRELCETIVRDYGSGGGPWTRDAAAYLCSLGPGSVADLDRVVAIERQVVAEAPDEYAYRDTLGAILYRAGRFEEAIRELEKSIRLHGKGGAESTWLYLSMANSRLGRRDHARRWLDKLDEELRNAVHPREGQIPTSWEHEVHRELLRGEAERLIRGG